MLYSDYTMVKGVRYDATALNRAVRHYDGKGNMLKDKDVHRIFLTYCIINNNHANKRFVC